MTASDPQKIEAAARDFAAATAAALKLPTGWHPPTVITACARMAGTYLFRSFGLALSTVSPGQVVLSPAASQYAPALIQYMATVLQGLSVDIASEPPSEAARGAAKSMREFLDTQRLIEPLFAPIQTKHGLTTEHASPYRRSGLANPRQEYPRGVVRLDRAGTPTARVG